MPTVSIIIPVYNTENYLRKCLDSVINQTYKDFEAILVDDGSTDKSGVICDEYAVKDSRFKVIHKQNEGVVKARITAFENSNGKLITFLDSDDYIYPQYVEKLAGPIIIDNVDISAVDFYTDNDGDLHPTPHTVFGTFEGDGLREFVAQRFFYDKKLGMNAMNNFLCTKMVKKELVADALEAGIGMWYGEDTLSLYHILRRCNKMTLLPDKQYVYVQHEGQVTKRYDPSIWDSIIKLMSRYDEIDVEGSSKEGRRIRTWLYIHKTMMEKMLKSGLSRTEFCKQFSKVRNTAFMRNFFRPFSLDMGINQKVLYWLLKAKLYSLFYFLKKK